MTSNIAPHIYVKILLKNPKIYINVTIKKQYVVLIQIINLAFCGAIKYIYYIYSQYYVQEIMITSYHVTMLK